LPGFLIRSAFAEAATGCRRFSRRNTDNGRKPYQIFFFTKLPFSADYCQSVFFADCRLIAAFFLRRQPIFSPSALRRFLLQQVISPIIADSIVSTLGSDFEAEAVAVSRHSCFARLSPA